MNMISKHGKKGRHMGGVTLNKCMYVCMYIYIYLMLYLHRDSIHGISISIYSDPYIGPQSLNTSNHAKNPKSKTRTLNPKH